MLVAVITALLVGGGLWIFFWQLTVGLDEGVDHAGRRRMQELLQRPAMRERLGLPPLPDPAVGRVAERARTQVRAEEPDGAPARGLRADLIRADLRLRPLEFHVISASLGLASSLLLWVSGRGEILALIIGAIAFYAPRWYLGRRKARRKARFIAQLADSLAVMAATLRSGASVNAAFQAVADNAEPPIRDEFARLVNEVGLIGIPLEQALGSMVGRMRSTELEFVGTAVRVNQEVGGNLANILDSVADTVREREKLQGKIKVLTTQAEVTIKMMTALPLGFGLLMGVMQPAAMGEFTTSLCGRVLLATAGLLIVLGYLLSKKLGSVRV